MDYINLNKKPHCFEKVNLLTKHDSQGIYDLYRCKYCGLEGKRYSLSSRLLVDISLKKVNLCDGREIPEDNLNNEKSTKKVRIKVKNSIFGAENLKVGDIVDVIRNSERGVWVKGVECTEEMKRLDPDYKGEVLLLFGEIEAI